MKIFSLTPIGQNLASSPNNSGSDSMRILYYLRRNGGSSSDEKICDHLNMNGSQLRVAMSELMRNNAVKMLTSA